MGLAKEVGSLKFGNWEICRFECFTTLIPKTLYFIRFTECIPLSGIIGIILVSNYSQIQNRQSIEVGQESVRNLFVIQI